MPGGMPQYTYVSRTERDLEKRLKSAKDNLCKLVTLTGSTKSGKTVLVNRVFPRLENDSIWIDGGIVKEEDDLWSAILNELNGFTLRDKAESTESGQGLSGGAEAEIGIPLITKGKGKINTSLEKKQISSSTKTLALSSRTAAITQIKESEVALIIDDFHYLDRAFQGSVIRALKPLVFEGYPVILIAIPHRRYDAVKVEREMTGRLEPITVPAWSEEELEEIPKIGFPLLNVEVSDKVVTRLVSEAYGSPHLMQEFCRELARIHNVEETAVNTVRISAITTNLFSQLAEGTGKVIFDKLSKGPRQRTDRIQRPLADGGQADIYKVVLLALAQLTPGMERVNYETLRATIKEVLADNIPQAHEVSRVLEKMSEIASDDEASTPVIDWDKEEQQLHITDPFFAFFLKWGAKEIR